MALRISRIISWTAAFIVLSAMTASAHAEDLSYPAIELSGPEAQNLSKATISSRERTAEFTSGSGALRFQTDPQWFGDRAVTPATITPDHAAYDFSFRVNTYRCVAAWGCETRTITLPVPLGTFGEDEVRAACGDQQPVADIGARLSKYFYCRESYRRMQAAGATDARSHPASSFALWGWYKSAFELFTMYRYHQSVPFFSRDFEVWGIMREKVASSDSDAFFATLAVERDRVANDLNSGTVYMSQMQYAQQLLAMGEVLPARDVLADVLRTIDEPPGVTLGQKDRSYLETLKAMAGVK